MRFFPFETFELKTSLNNDEVREILDNNIERNEKFGAITYNYLFGKKILKKYRGYANQNVFRLIRIPKWGINHFIPMTNGEIQLIDNGSIIKLKIRFHYFLYFILFLFVFFSIASVVVQINNSNLNSELKEIYEDQSMRETMREVLTEEEFNSLFNENRSNNINWTSIFSPVFLYIFIMLLYNYESQIVKADLRGMINERRNVC